MASILFGISIVSGTTIVVLSAASVVTGKFQFWPPPSKNTWQYSVFWLLFRIMFISLMALCFADFNSMNHYSNTHYIVGIPLIMIGFGSAIYSTSFLGWRNAHGESLGLKTDGLYQWSRNPIYVSSIIGMVGIGVTANSLSVYLVLLLWGLMYVIAPFIEEPWLEKQYGQEYSAYKTSVPRFIGVIKYRN